MMKLSDRDWAPFYISELFNIESCKCSRAIGLKVGLTPYIGATNRNNGILKFVDSESLITKGNCIVFICDGDGSIGYNIYKKEDFIGSTTLKVGRNKYLNKYVGLFITTVADKVRNSYDFGYKRNEGHLKNEKLYLPINTDLQPDYVFMEEYMREKETILKEQYKKFVASRLNEKIEKPIPPKEWKEFFVSELFNHELSKGDNQAKLLSGGNVPLISAGNAQNGVCKYIKEGDGKSQLFNSNTITIDMFGKAFFQPAKFYAVSHGRVNILYPKININKNIGLFLCCILERKIFGKYTFSNMCNKRRLQNESIRLPITSFGEPDYVYMENYMKYLEQKKLSEYLKYIEKSERV